MKIFILTEGGKGIGFGHIARCMSLYQAFSEDDIHPVFIINGDESVKRFLSKHYSLKPFLFNWIAKRKELLSIIDDSDVVIIDSYMAGADIYREIKKSTGLLACIDDINRLDYNADIVINGSIYGGRLKYDNPNTEYLVGPRYVMLRKAFWDVPRKEIREEIKAILITLGSSGIGGDRSTLLMNVLLKETGYDLHVIGKGTERNRVRFYDELNEEEMKRLMLEMDLCITAGGQTVYELARIGLPSIGICLAENQYMNLKEFDRIGFLNYVGWYNDEDLESKVLESIRELISKSQRRERYEIGRALVDGKGSKRIIRKINEIIH